MTTNRRSTHLLVALAVLAASCGSASTATTPVPASSSTPSTTEVVSTTATSNTPTTLAPVATVDSPASETAFHTAPRLASVAEFMSYARTGVANQAVVKFSIPDFTNGDSVEWMDSKFYELHDEWYWFQLLNGQAIPSGPTPPVQGLSFNSVEEVYDWAEAIPPNQLPLDLDFVGGSTSPKRLYSREFYDLALHTEPRVFGAGSLIRYGSADDEIRWLLELEYTDDGPAEDVATFFERLRPTLPDEIGAKLEWVVRSPQQEAVAQRMISDALPFSDRVVRYEEFVPQGEVAVYTEGLTAGRLLLIEDGEAQLTDAVDTDIVLIEGVPDWLPPASGLITSSPQTPLAHVNLLARNRGIPNASQAGLLDDAEIRQAARVRAPAIVRASGNNSLEVILITEEEYRVWRSKVTKPSISVPPVVSDELPLVVSLEEIASNIRSEADVEAWRPVIGGKSAGFLALLGADGVTTPETPLAITVRPYLEHLDSVQEALTAMLSNADFADSARTRFLLLEGGEDFAEQYPEEDDAEFAVSFAEKHPPGTPLGDVLEAGGFARYFRDAPLDPEALSELTTILEDEFGSYASTQGLRFRSSSSVEDIEGFSGAGLYDSNTGFLDPLAQLDEDDHKKSIERTLKKTWASYWNFEAFEERRRERVSHTSGAMGVLVHARFDDALEVNNGVATFTLLPESADRTALVEINVQVGDESVTNPDPLDGNLPEVISVRMDANGELEIVRVENSTLAPQSDVLTDGAVSELVGQLEAVATLWRNRVNRDLPPEQQIQTLTLDFEFKTMANGWPALANGTMLEGRLVVKQARSLDPGIRGIPDEVLRLGIRRDVLARATRVAQLACGSEVHIEVLTDPLVLPDVGYGSEPLILGPTPALGSTCETTVLYSTPTQYLLELLNTKAES